MRPSHRQSAGIGALTLLLLVGVTVGIGATGAVTGAAGPADFDDASTPAAVGVDDPFTVDATTIADRDDVATVCWKFDEGETCHDAETTHSFGEAGSHTATLIVTDTEGERESITRLIVATAPPSAELNAEERVEIGAEVRLDASETIDDHGIERYEWDLNGDGTVDETTTSPTIDHAFESTGTHEVTVTVVDAAGQSDTASASIDAVDPPSGSDGSSSSSTGAAGSTGDDAGDGNDAGDASDDGGDAGSASEDGGSDTTDGDADDGAQNDVVDGDADDDESDDVDGANETGTAAETPGFGVAVAVLALLTAAFGQLYRRR